MIRLVYKTILISIISSMLMIGDMVAFADTLGAASQNSDGTYQKTNTYDMNSSKDDSSLNVIAMLAIGSLAVQMLQYPKWSYDMMAAAAGGAAYMVGEVMNVINTKNELDKLSVKLDLKSDGKMDSKQVEYIKTLKESYEKVLEALKRKKMLLYVALAGFGVAAGIAAYQKFMQEANFQACTSVITAQTAVLQPCIAAGAVAAATVVAVNEARACGMMQTQKDLLFTGILELETRSFVPEPSLEKAASDTTTQAKIKTQESTPPGGTTAEQARLAIVGACEPYLAHHQVTAAYGMFLPKAAYYKPINQSIKEERIANLYNMNFLKEIKSKEESNLKIKLKNILEKFIPAANAGYMSMMGLGVGAIGTYLLIKNGMATYLDRILSSPGLRIITWGVMAGITYLAINATQAKADDVQSNIDKIDKILNETDRLAHGISVSASAKRQSVIVTEAALFSEDVQLSKTQKTSCVNDKTASASNACTSMTSMSTSLPGIQDMPTGLTSVMSQLTGVADGLSGKGTISGATMTKANAIGSKAISLIKYAKQQQKSLNDLLKEQGKGVIDFDAEQAKVKAGMFGTISDTLKSKGQSPSGFLASLGMSGIPSSSSSETAASAGDKLFNKKGSGKIAPAGIGAIPTDKAPEFKLLDDKEGTGVLANGMAEGTANDKYEIKGNEINNDSKTSIFEVISERYLKSGYPKLLEEEKPALKK